MMVRMILESIGRKQLRLDSIERAWIEFGLHLDFGEHFVGYEGA